MAVLRFPNRTGQRGVFQDDTVDYVDVDLTYDEIVGYTRFDTKATAESWATDDVVGILILKNSTNWAIWTAKCLYDGCYYPASFDESDPANVTTTW